MDNEEEKKRKKCLNSPPFPTEQSITRVQCPWTKFSYEL